MGHNNKLLVIVNVFKSKLLVMCDVLSRLPKDLQLIVHRLVFDHNYRHLRNQYREIWLTIDYEYKSSIWWSDVVVCFINNYGSPVANWRYVGLLSNDNIYRFAIGKKKEMLVVGVLPRKY